MSPARKREETAIDGLNLIAGLALATAPWWAGFAGSGTAQWNALATGGLISLIAIGALIAFAPWEEWVNLVAGLWAAIAPWALDLSYSGNAAAVHVCAGIFVAVLAALELRYASENRRMMPVR